LIGLWPVLLAEFSLSSVSSSLNGHGEDNRVP